VSHLDDWDGFGQRLTGSGTTLYRLAASQARMAGTGPSHPEPHRRDELAIKTPAQWSRRSGLDSGVLSDAGV
jgi:hypothetical protein